MIESGFSLVVCTHNGCAKLPATLSHLSLLKLPAAAPVELLVIDNASTDNTSELTENTWQHFGCPFPLRIIKESKAGKGYAIETGYDAAQYEWIITVDDDNWLREDYLMVALGLINSYPEVGIFQACNKPVFEKDPPLWLQGLEGYFVIGSPVKKEGYFPQNYYGVWGAGMIIKNADWQLLRKLGFSALTSKIAGKAAGEDVELAIGILLLGKQIYFSKSLHYQHYMPQARMQWKVLEKNFEVFAYTAYYFFLYSLILEAHKKGYKLTTLQVTIKFIKLWLKMMKSRGAKDNLMYLFNRQKKIQHLLIRQYYHTLYWFIKNTASIIQHISFIQRWVIPLLKKQPTSFSM